MHAAKLEDILFLKSTRSTCDLVYKIGRGVGIDTFGINIALIYTHNFYKNQDVYKYELTEVACVAIFLAAKFAEQPINLERIVLELHKLQKRIIPIKIANLINLESVFLTTLRFNLNFELGHLFVIDFYKLGGIPKAVCDLAYGITTKINMLTSLSLQIKPQMIACLSIQLACSKLQYEMPITKEKTEWCMGLDKTATLREIDSLIERFPVLRADVL